MEEALRRIATNKLTKEIHLDLEQTNLISLPKELFELKWLQSLNLSNNRIRDASTLQHLTQIIELNLSNNRIQHLSGMPQLPTLTKLNLSFNHLQHLRGMPQLPALIELDLSYNQLQDLSGMPQLPTLIKLDLSYNRIQDLSGMPQLPALTELDLNSNELQDLRGMPQLPALIELDLSYNQLQDLSGMPQLPTLIKLDLSYNRIQDLSGIPQLPTLMNLTLSYNKLQHLSGMPQLPDLIELHLNSNKLQDLRSMPQLPALSELNLNSNELQDLSSMPQLPTLIKLNLSDNKLQNLSDMPQLPTLIKLTLSDNQLQDLSGMPQLPALTELDLNSNELQDLSSMPQLPALSELNLKNNELQDLSSMPQLPTLMNLNLNSNQLQNISPLLTMRHLIVLDISANRVSDIEQVKSLTDIHSLEELKFERNQVKAIPKELSEIFNNCLNDLRDYFKDQTQSGFVINNEIKVVLLGNGRVGKTCLYKRLVYNTFDKNEESTHAIQLVKWVCALPDNLKALAPMGLQELILNIWDFGGQDIYHATHRLFMKTQALFVLVWDLDSEQSTYSIDTSSGQRVQYPNYPLSYWLNYVKTLGQNSPIIVVQTKIIKNEAILEQLPQKSEYLKAMYPIVRFEHIDSAHPPSIGTGFIQLKNTLQHTALNILKTTNTKLPLNWYQLRSKITELATSQQQINLESFRKLCLENGLKDTSPDTVLSYLHNSGVVFYQSGLFGNQIILDQKWAIDAVYALFDRKKLFYQIKEGRNGKFTLKELKWVWADYTLAEQLLFISFMKGCELCYDVKDNQNRMLPPEESVYLAPALLADQKPSSVEGAWKRNEGLYWQFQHEFLHYSIIQSFIVRMGNLENVKIYEVWKNGVWIEHADGEALIEAFPMNKKIMIRVRDKDANRLLDKIHHEFYQIHGNETEIQEWVSLDGANFINLVELQKKSKKQHQHITSQEGNEFQINDFNIFLHLDKKSQFLDTGQETDSAKGNKLNNKQMDKRLIKLFISYSHKDEKIKKQFDEALEVLKNLGKIEVWEDRQILAGSELNKNIFENLDKADIVCLLISPTFMASKYCFGKEMQAALRKYDAGNGVVVPIIIKETALWHQFEIGKFNAVPTDGRPISSWPKKDAAWRDVIEKINKLIDSLQAKI
ncbi:leucine-rich repeat domain-containing protein [Rhodocytophaga aerolata]|uniref:non-specific serine/threonine protein kinase n=1 Tax=Rhodocytophaga aerolata TaxID=455078 RepID=A0ABT8R5N8_9BACT|nr:leucine-rich repeat domain-containing protein [Rhodocytophaga aerolata]MDO1447410.1 leucine-rich repeat domain-containing protein [Rhodocytophaga aerolata]